MYSEYSTEDLVGFVVEMGDDEKLDQIIDFKKSVDINNNIVNVKEVVFRSGKNRQNLVDFVNENYAEDYGIGGFLLGSAIGGYAGYKIGRARPQKRGFETEKKIGRKLKSGFKEIRANAKKHALGGEIDREEYATYTEAIRDYGKEKVEDEYNVKILSRTEAKRVMEKYEDAEVKTPEGEFLMDEPEQINDYPYFILGVGVWEDENKEILEDLNIPFTSYAKGGSINTQVAQTIMQQLGGMNKVIAMTGAYNFATDGKNVSFRIKNKKINHIKITLNGRDLYDVEFGRLWGSKFTVVSEYNDVYFDQLIPLFEENTGMYLKLFDKGGKI